MTAPGAAELSVRQSEGKPGHASARVAVIIVTWNSGRHLDRCLNALKQQTLRPAQIIVVDNASTDGAPVPVARNLQYIQMGFNAGFAAANNRGIRASDGVEWVALLNPDAFPEPQWLEQLVAASVANPQFHFFASRQLMDDADDRLDGAGDAYHTSGLHWRRHYGQPAASADHPKEVFAACAASAMYRLQDLVAINGFDESFFCYAEDVDLGFRLQLVGRRCLYVPGAVVRHIGSATTGRASDFCVYHGHRNLVWAYVKNMPGLLFWAYLPQHLLLNLATILVFALRGRGRIVLRAKLDAVRGLAKIYRARKVVQGQRLVSLSEIRSRMARGLMPLLSRSRGVRV